MNAELNAAESNALSWKRWRCMVYRGGSRRSWLRLSLQIRHNVWSITVSLVHSQQHIFIHKNIQYIQFCIVKTLGMANILITALKIRYSLSALWMSAERLVFIGPCLFIKFHSIYVILFHILYKARANNSMWNAALHAKNAAQIWLIWLPNKHILSIYMRQY